MSANIVLSLSTTKLEVAPGESVEATITIRNQSQIVDQFGIRIEGLDPTWWTLSTSSVSLFPGDEGEARLTIHPPKEAEAKAGSYSCQVRAVSQANPEEMTEETAYLILRGFLVWDVEMSPTRAAGASGTYRITASNSGNTDITLTFEGKDPEEALEYTFSHDKVIVPAGETALITLRVRPKRREKGRLYSYQVIVKPAETKVSSRETRTINGQLEYRPPRRPWIWILLGLAIVAVAFLVWRFILPRPVVDFAANRDAITAGDRLTLSWNVSGATQVTIDQELEGVDLDTATGKHTVYPTMSTIYTLTARNAIGKSKMAQVAVTVLAPPVINGFDADPPIIGYGDSSTLRWDVSGATTVTIISNNLGDSWTREVSPVDSMPVTPKSRITHTYTLEAANDAGGIVTGTVDVQVALIDPWF